MTWFERLGSSLRTEARSAVDVRGDETTLLREHVRAAEEAVQRKRAAFAELAAEAARLSAEREHARADCERFDHDTELALDGEREDLARYALGLLLRRQRVMGGVERRLAQVDKERKELEVVLARQQAALAELRRRTQAFVSSYEAARFGAAVEPVTDQEVELALLHRLQARAARAGETRASA